MKSIAELSKLCTKAHVTYGGSVLSPVAPEWSTGNVLLGSLYRQLVLGITEGGVDRAKIDTLPDELPDLPLNAWKMLLHRTDAVAHPASRGEKLGLRNVIPLVPELARHGCVTGRPRNRWTPGNLFNNALAAGAGMSEARTRLHKFKKALEVGEGEDIFSSYLERKLQKSYLERELQNLESEPRKDLEENFYSPLFRDASKRTENFSPSEQLCKDLEAVIKLKGRLTRRQWTVLLEALLRLAMSTHMLWILRVNREFWRLIKRAIGLGEVATLKDIEGRFWRDTMSKDEPLIALGAEWTPQTSKALREYGEARLGINALVHILGDVGHGWDRNPLGGLGNTSPPLVELVNFLKHCAKHRAKIVEEAKRYEHESFASLANALADANNTYVLGERGAPKNIDEFIKYTCQQFSTKDDELISYDQSHLCLQKGAHKKGRYIVRLGPNLLILLVHACCKSQPDGVPASLDDFRTHLMAYGIRGSLSDLQHGSVGAELERLGLVVDSPDAGGGRLLVNPFHEGDGA